MARPFRPRHTRRTYRAVAREAVAKSRATGRLYSPFYNSRDGWHVGTHGVALPAKPARVRAHCRGWSEELARTPRV